MRSMIAAFKDEALFQRCQCHPRADNKLEWSADVHVRSCKVCEGEGFGEEEAGCKMRDA